MGDWCRVCPLCRRTANTIEDGLGAPGKLKWSRPSLQRLTGDHANQHKAGAHKYPDNRVQAALFGLGGGCFGLQHKVRFNQAWQFRAKPRQNQGRFSQIAQQCFRADVLLDVVFDNRPRDFPDVDIGIK